MVSKPRAVPLKVGRRRRPNWLIMLGLSLITQSHINAGAFGLFGFPIIALVYALIRVGADQSPSEIQWLRQRVAELEQEIARRSISEN
jgi:hypothetical protein